MCRLCRRSWIRSEVSGNNSRHIRLSETRTCTQYRRYAPKWLSMGQENVSTVSNTPGNAKTKLKSLTWKAVEKAQVSARQGKFDENTELTRSK